MQAIKVGNKRVVVERISHIITTEDVPLLLCSDGSVGLDFAPDEDTFLGLCIEIYFGPGGDSEVFVRLLHTQAEEFLRQFDELTGITASQAATTPLLT